MKINKKSWHYRLLKFMEADVPTSLCPYFWKVVFLTIFAVVFSAFFIAGALVIYIIDKIDATKDAKLKALSQEAMKTGDWSKYDAFLHPKRKTKKEPGLIRAWLRARKEKVCPKLEFE